MPALDGIQAEGAGENVVADEAIDPVVGAIAEDRVVVGRPLDMLEAEELIALCVATEEDLAVRSIWTPANEER